MNRAGHGITTALGALALALALASAGLSLHNQGLRRQLAERQQYVQMSVQLEGLYRELVRALAELGARNNDDAVRTMLGKHGITYNVNGAGGAPAAPAATATGGRK